jgi:hypothetical protein
MIDPVTNALFIHIQKTAGNSIATAFGQPHSGPQKHWTALEMRDLLGEARWAALFKFAFVRNPWDRLVSWWAMIDGHRAAFEQGRQLNRFQTYILTNARTFAEFVENCSEEIVDSDGRKCVHRNQLDYLTDASGTIIVDFVGRSEALADDMAQIARRLGRAPFDIPHLNASPGRAAYPTYYDDRLAQRVGEIYARDIAAFGYTFGE